LKNIRNIFVVVLLVSISAVTRGQAVPTASRLADVQVGVDFSNAKPDYQQDLYNLAEPGTSQSRWNGYGAYANMDLRYHFGLEFDFHNVSGPDSVQYERTFEVGGRYLYPIGWRFVPYGKAMIGRGIFNFAAQDATTGKAYQIANLAYNMESFGGGLDFKMLPGLNIRLFDYEYQRWNNFPPRSLNPNVISVGVAYHFHGPMSLKK